MLDAAYERLVKALDVELSAATELVELSVTIDDPALAKRLLELIVERFNRLYRDEAIQSSDRLIAYINERLSATSTMDVRNMLIQLYGRELNKRMLSTIHRDHPFQVVDPAEQPRKPTFPTPRIMFAAAALAVMTLVLLITLAVPAGRSSSDTAE